MRHYIYIENGNNVVVTMAEDYNRDDLLSWAKTHTPAGCPIFLLSDEELEGMNGSPIEAISFDASQADGLGEVEE